MILLNRIIFLGILLIPFMSFPILGSQYRPISFLFFTISAFLIILSNNRTIIKKDQFWLFLFILIASLQTIILVGINFDSMGYALRNILPLIIGFFAYLSMQYYFIRITNLEGFILKLAKYSTFIIVIGLIQLFSKYNLINIEFLKYLNIFFSGIDTGRIQLTTSEASWGARVLITLIPFYLFYYLTFDKFKYTLILSLLIFVGIFSFDGFISFFSALLMLIVSGQIKILNIKNFIKLFTILFLMILILINLYSYIGGYVGDRINLLIDINFFDAIDVLRNNESSTFIRINYPIIAFQMFLDNPLGYGLGSFSFYFTDYIHQDVSHLKEVYNNILTQSADSKSFIAKLLSECGLISGTIFIYFLSIHYKYYKKIKNNENRRLILFLAIFIFSSMLQFGSFAYLPLWFVLALNYAFYYKEKREITNENTNRL